MAGKQISSAEGLAAIRSCLAALTATPLQTGEPAGADYPILVCKTAVRWGLQELVRLAPGRAVEVRVPPAGAVQILGGTVHRRGTPPAVIEMSMETFVALAAGLVRWEDFSEGAKGPAVKLSGARGKALYVDASGERANIGHLFPLL